MKWMSKFLLILVLIGNFIGNISTVAATDINTAVTTSLENENDFLNSLKESQASLPDQRELLTQKNQTLMSLMQPLNQFKQSEGIPSTTIKKGDFELHGNYSFDDIADSGSVKLNWVGLPNLADGYKVERSTDDVNWEEISSNYGKKVKILNVYPNDAKYLKAWMTPITDSIEVDEVSLEEFNKNYKDYIEDDGSSIYDGLYFGSADSNGGWVTGVNDLTDKSQPVVAKFADTGRSIILGHDTISTAQTGHKYFNTFAPKLDLWVRYLPGQSTDYKVGNSTNWLSSRQVQISNSGSLTKYPFKITSTVKDISLTHTVDQYYLYNSDAIRWMVFVPPFKNNDQGPELKEPDYLYDNQNRKVGDDNWYLITKNNYAMIQTGHITGSCTPDEAKIIANTIYYTSTLNTSNSGTDPQAKDKVAPNTPNLTSNDTNNDKFDLTIKSQDNPSYYYYQVTGNVNDKTSNKLTPKSSDVIQQQALSDIKGYFYAIDSTSNPGTNAANVKYKDSDPSKVDTSAANFLKVTQPNTNGNSATLTNDQLLKNSKNYIHVVAVDRDNNISTVQTKKISDLVSSKRSVKIKVWMDSNYNGIIDTNEKIKANMPIHIFKKNTDDSYEELQQTTNSTIKTGNDGTCSVNDLQSNTYYVGLKISDCRAMFPTVSGGKSISQLINNKANTISHDNYFLTTAIIVNKDNDNRTVNLGLIDQLGFISITKLPQLNFGISLIPYAGSISLPNPNKDENTLTIEDNRTSLQTDLSDYFVPYKVNIQLSAFKQGKEKGLQGSSITLTFPNENTVTVSSEQADKQLLLTQQPSQNTEDITKFKNISLNVPQKSIATIIKPGTYTATMTYEIEDTP
ncbi:hypothetical protein GYU96_06125 [Lactobacillus mellis]|uniref:hypothetical protein n=1 Tax=Bombilactobacillus mellis TaxID=1218508 RepID=UPI00157FF9C1|nr:hypothetical protein [Bombilactobacillus mellis]NUG67437.1 hypothetical protein [Bombilactobacillus mellis]